MLEGDKKLKDSVKILTESLEDRRRITKNWWYCIRPRVTKIGSQICDSAAELHKFLLWLRTILVTRVCFGYDMNNFGYNLVKVLRFW